MPQTQEPSQTPHRDWDASGRTVDAEQAQGHAPEQVTAIQLALVSMGYTLNESTEADGHDGDGVDGQWSEATRLAVVQFQDDNGLESSGKLDDDTEEAILRAYGEALVSSQSGAAFTDALDGLQMGDAHTSIEAALQAESTDALDDLVPGDLPDEPVADVLDDVSAARTR